jgi:hypothetical protein
MAAVEWLQRLLLQESSNRRIAYGLAIAGHLIIVLILLLSFFGRTEPAPIEAMPVEIVTEEPPATPPAPVATPNEVSKPDERSNLPNIPAVADAEKHAKAQPGTVDANGVDQPKQPGHDGGDPNLGQIEDPTPRADGDMASGASLPSWAVEPVGLAQQQATARESGEDELTAIKEAKLECGAKATQRALRARTRGQATVRGIATPAQALALVRSTQVMMDRHINPNYLANMEVFTDTWQGRTVVVLPAGVTVNVGEMIDFDYGYVDPSNPCQYIPNLAVGKR